MAPSSKRQHRGLAAVTTLIAGLAFVALPAAAAAKPGDLFVADRFAIGNACGGNGCGAVFRIDPAAPAPVPLASGPPFYGPWDVDFDRDGSLLVADDGGPEPGAVFRVDPVSGTRVPVAQGAPFVNPHWLAVGPDGAIYVSDYTGSTVYRIDPATGAVAPFLAAEVVAPSGIVIDPAGTTMYVVEDSGPNSILRVDLASRTVTPIFSGPPLRVPEDLELTPDGELLIADHEGSPDFGGALFRLDPRTGAFRTISQGDPFNSPAGIALDPGGDVFLANRSAGTGFLGAIFRVDPETGSRPIIAQGAPFAAPTGLAIEPPRCGGRPATIVGGAGSDRLAGSPFDDVIVAFGGGDRVGGGQGRDVICGGKGNDRLSGGPGRDRLIGGKGKRDICKGGKGKDRGKGCERGRL